MSGFPAGGHGVDLLPILAALVAILIAAKLGGSLLVRFGQSAVLGELLGGVVLGNLGLIGFHGLDAARDLPAIEVLAQIGVLFLLFGVGLETDARKMAAVGLSSFMVAVLGVIAPMVLGFFVTRAFFPAHDALANWFVAATLCATSVGITARVLSDLGRATSREGRIILGAAVIDDVLGLVVLAVVAGIIQAADRGQPFAPLSVLLILGKALAFIAAALAIGPWVSSRMFRLASRLDGDGWPLALALVLCFGLALLAGVAGLAPIVGAFSAGLIVDEAHLQALRARDPERRSLHALLAPITSFLVPVFFALMGMRVDLRSFARVEILGFAAALTAVAVIGKQVCSFGVLEKGTDRLAVGLGMIPRGEVGLILANIGATLMVAGQRVVTDDTYSAVVMMVALTTLMTPPLLTWRMGEPKAAPAVLPEPRA